MKPSDFSRRMVGYYKARKNVYVRSAPGRGKSTMITEGVPKIGVQLGLNLGLSVVNCCLLTPADTVGYLVPTKAEHNGVQHIESKYTSPFWWVTQEGRRLEEYDGGIVFLDEMDKADTDVKKVLGEMMLSGRCGPHKLPEGWVVWGAGNRSDDRSGSTKDLDHLINRRAEIELTDDIASLEAWMASNGIAPEIIAFAAGNPEIVFSPKPPDKQQPWCTPRSLVMAGHDLEAFRDERGMLPIDPLAIEDTAGRIGNAAASALFNTIRLAHEMPEFADIIRLPEKVKVPQKPDAQMLVAYNLAHRVDVSSLGPVLVYLKRFPKEFAITFAKAACRREPMLLCEDAFEEWAQENATLMTAIVDAG